MFSFLITRVQVNGEAIRLQRTKENIFLEFVHFKLEIDDVIHKHSCWKTRQ